MFRIICCLSVILLLNSALAVPKPEEEKEPIDDNSSDSSGEDDETTTIISSNGTGQNLLIIRSVVYEIGILTDAGNDTDTSNETHEEIDLSFFDPGHNGSLFDLSHIPVPIQTNISGVSVTGVVPGNFGSLAIGEDGIPNLNGSTFPLLPNKQVKVTHNVSTVDKLQEAALLSQLSSILGLDKIGNFGSIAQENGKAPKSNSS